jgi:hypothetical protein
MGISATTRGLRPGVCTSTNRPSSPFEGMVIYETDTNRVLVWDNAAWVMIADTDSPPGLQLIKSQTVGTAVSSVTVSDVFSSEFDNYRVVIGDMDASTDGNFIYLRFGSTATSYYGSLQYGRYGSTNGYYYTNNGTQATIGLTDSNDTCNISFDVFSPNLAARSSLHGQSFGYDYSTSYAFMVATVTQYTSFDVIPQSGTLTGGIIRVYGYRN